VSRRKPKRRMNEGAPRYKILARAGDVWLIPGDMHFPIQDPNAIRVMKRWFEREYIHKCRMGVILQGDSVDSHSVTRHPKNAERFAAFPTLVSEARTIHHFLTWAGETDNGGYYLQGNHEDWVADIIQQHPGLEGAPGMEFQTLTGLGEIPGIEWVPYGSWIQLGEHVHICHGDHPGFPKAISGVARKYPNQCTIYGHTHKSDYETWTIYDRGVAKTMWAMNVGHMGQVPEYVQDPDWQRAFGVVEFFGDRGDGQPLFRGSLHHVIYDKNGEAHVA
jgi:predicted phosphodiesterase